MALLLSLTLTAGMLLILSALTGGRRTQRAVVRPSPDLLRRFRARGGDEVGTRELALSSGVVAAGTLAGAQLLLGWPVLSLAAGAVGLFLPGWYFQQRSVRRRAEVEEAVAEAADALRDASRVGIGLEEGARMLARSGPLALRPVMREVERESRLSGFDAALRRARDRVADPVFDTFVAALLMSYRTGGRNLSVVLDGLSRSIRATVRARREVRAAQAQNVLSARVIAALPLALIVVLRAASPGYLEVFSTPGGQAVLAFCLVSVVAGYMAMLRAAAVPDQGRVLR